MQTPSARPAHSRRRRGTAATEFALWLAPMMILLAGIVDGAFYVSGLHDLARISRDAARVGSATHIPFGGGGQAIEDAAIAHARLAADAAGYPDADIDARFGVDEADRGWVTVTIASDHNPFFHGLSPFGERLSYDFAMLTMEQPNA